MMSYPIFWVGDGWRLNGRDECIVFIFLPSLYVHTICEAAAAARANYKKTHISKRLCVTDCLFLISPEWSDTMSELRMCPGGGAASMWSGMQIDAVSIETHKREVGSGCFFKKANNLRFIVDIQFKADCSCIRYITMKLNPTAIVFFEPPQKT